MYKSSYLPWGYELPWNAPNQVIHRIFRFSAADFPSFAYNIVTFPGNGLRWIFKQGENGHTYVFNKNFFACLPVDSDPN